ncbi:MAG: tripartite tricarboxylate transporter substrate binding protein [Betaproteobacteria bacterium]|nr:tripartite tricarboxylate transporter substrate binding protein [Betaproteobacteria bacterium]
MCGRVRFRCIATSLVLAVFCSGAQAFPTRPVTMIVPQPPGGANDVLVRTIALKLQEIWGQPVVVDYRPGGGVVVGTQALARSAPDGHTIGLITSAHTINANVRKDLPYDSVKDFAPVARVGHYVIAMVAVPALEANDVKGALALARQKNGQLEYASIGIGGSTHLAGELLKLMGGVDMVHIPYNGSAPAYRDMLGGRVSLAFVILNSALPHVKAGKLKVIGITNPKRSEVYREFPTIGETIPGYELITWAGFAVPGAVPAEWVQKLSADAVTAMGAPEVRRKLTDSGLEPAPQPANEFQAFLRSETERWGKIVREVKFKLD